MEKTSGTLKIGWAQADITPDQPVLLAGQFHARVSEGVLDPVTATALAMESTAEADSHGRAIMISCDLASIGDELRDAVRMRIKAAIDDFDPRCLFMGATHTHSAPDARIVPYGMASCGPDYKRAISGQAAADAEKFGMWPSLGLAVMSPADYLAFAADRIAEAAIRAWQQRAPSGVAYGLGFAVVGRNRRLTFRDGSGRMYANAAEPEFSHVEGYEDHSVYAMMTYDRDETLTGIVVNVACPSQVSEHIYRISADYWHETREALRRRFGKHIHVLPQCAPAGDQSPHVLIGKRAEQRMWRLKGRDPDQNAPRQEIAQRIADAISDMEPHVRKALDWHAMVAHRSEVLHLPRRLITGRDVEAALEEARPFKEQYETLLAEIDRNPGIRNTPRWYTDITKAYRRMERGKRVQKRFELQQQQPDMPIEVHALRLGEMAFATNPFELYLDYAVRIRERCKATQTFLVQKAGCNGTYLPSARSIGGGGYGSVPASTDIGPEGGDQLVVWTIKTLNDMFE